MKEIYTALYPNEQVAKAVGDYSYEHSAKLPKHITEHHAWGAKSSERPDFMISPFQAQFQIWMAKTVGAKRILEIGVYIGFSTMGWAEAVGSDGHVTGLEFSPEYAKISEESFAKNGIKNIDIIVGDANESLKTLATAITEPFDLIFIDADKTSYPNYLSLILSLSTSSAKVRLLRPGGLIIADNVLRRGMVADSSDANPWVERAKIQSPWQLGDIQALKDFNRAMVESPRLETFLMPMFDGLGMGRLLD